MSANLGTRYGHGVPFARAIELARTTTDALLERQLGGAQLIGAAPDVAEPHADDDEEWSFQTRMMSHARATLKLALDASVALVFPIRKTRTSFASTILIGRSGASDVVIDHPSISKLHARIRRERGGEYQLRDAGSTNGTAIDGRAIGGAETLLRSGAEVRLGDWTFRFYLLAETAHLLRSA